MLAATTTPAASGISSPALQPPPPTAASSIAVSSTTAALEAGESARSRQPTPVIGPGRANVAAGAASSSPSPGGMAPKVRRQKGRARAPANKQPRTPPVQTDETVPVPYTQTPFGPQIVEENTLAASLAATLPQPPKAPRDPTTIKSVAALTRDPEVGAQLLSDMTLPPKSLTSEQKKELVDKHGGWRGFHARRDELRAEVAKKLDARLADVGHNKMVDRTIAEKKAKLEEITRLRDKNMEEWNGKRARRTEKLAGTKEDKKGDPVAMDGVVATGEKVSGAGEDTKREPVGLGLTETQGVQMEGVERGQTT